MLHQSIAIEGPRPSARIPGEPSRSRWPELAAAATALLFAACFLNITPVPDVAWQLWIAHQLRMGARLYTDIIETNPPLWFWQAMPIDWAASVLGIRSHALLIAVLGMASAASVWATGRLIRHVPPVPRAGLLVYAVLALLLTPLFFSGQREQIVFIAFLPYAALAAARREGGHVGALTAAAIGLAAFLGLALKHYFLIAPVLIELWLLVASRRAYRPVRPETVVLAAGGLLYALATILVTPDFLTRMVPLNRAVYAHITAHELGGMWRSMQIFWLMAAAALFLERRLARTSALTIAMLLAAAGFGLAWLIQFKGFPNHTIPVTGFLMMALAVHLVENRQVLGAAAKVAASVVLLLPLGYFAWNGSYRDLSAAVVQPLLRDVEPHRSVAFITYESDVAWPMSLYRAAPYPSRHYGMWIMQAVAFDRGRTPEIARIGRQLVEDTAQDYRCAQPARIFISRKVLRGLQLKDWFMASPSFADLMRLYRPLGTRHGLDVFQLQAPQGPRPASCRTAGTPG